MPLSLSEIVNDSELGQRFLIIRSSGTWGLGGWKNTSANIPAFGIISVATDEALDMVPEGDRVRGSMLFISQTRIYESNASTNQEGVSDQIQWNGQTYRIVSVGPWSDNQFWYAVGVRMSGK